MQALTSFNVISFFEDFTAASYIRDERVCASDKDKEEEEEGEKKAQSLQKPRRDARSALSLQYSPHYEPAPVCAYVALQKHL